MNKKGANLGKTMQVPCLGLFRRGGDELDLLILGCWMLAATDAVVVIIITSSCQNNTI